MSLKTVIPLALRKKEHELWSKSEYIAKAVVTESSSQIKSALKSFLQSILATNGIITCIVWSFDKMILGMVADKLSDTAEYKTFEPKGDFLVKSGAIVAQISAFEDMTNLVDYWGSLDRIQVILPFDDKKDKVGNFICSNYYIYNRHGFKTLDELMKLAEIIINDTGDGEEIEIIYHKGNTIDLADFLNE